MQFRRALEKVNSSLVPESSLFCLLVPFDCKRTGPIDLLCRMLCCEVELALINSRSLWVAAWSFACQNQVLLFENALSRAVSGPHLFERQEGIISCRRQYKGRIRVVTF